jgi:uncharacterized protein with HEPN domain
MNENDKVRLQHILDAINEIEEFTDSIDLTTFQTNRLVRNATIRSFEIIGEAVNSLSMDIKESEMIFPWQGWKDFRNVLIHQYFGVDYEMVYNTIQNDLPELKSKVKSLLK